MTLIMCQKSSNLIGNFGQKLNKLLSLPAQAANPQLTCYPYSSDNLIRVEYSLYYYITLLIVKMGPRPGGNTNEL